MTRVPVAVHRRRFLVPLWAAAQVPFPRTIWIKDGIKLTAALLAHELRHVIQFEQYGWRFPFLYVAQWAGVGFRYAHIPFEVEARKAEREPWYLAWASDILSRDAV